MNGLFKDLLKEFWVWVILIAALIFWLSSCTKPDDTNERIPKTYTVQKEQHDFKPSPFPLPEQAKSYVVTFMLDSSCWYNSLGVDNLDWNKLFGVYKWDDYKKNKNAVMVAWRPYLTRRNAFEICLYENINNANRPHEDRIICILSNRFYAATLLEENGRYTALLNLDTLGTQQNELRYRTIGKNSAWFGGNRTAPQRMKLQMDF
jgi:hypothetical protein